MVSPPPFGMASRALIDRLSRAFSNCAASIKHSDSSSLKSKSKSISLVSVRSSISATLLTCSLMLTSLGFNSCFLEKASSCWVSCAPFSLDTIAFSNMDLSSGRSSNSSLTISILPMMTANKLLKS